MNHPSTRILVVDDEMDTCRNLSDIFSDLGCEVDTASDGMTALEKARRTPFDVALVDLRMPGMDGLSVCRSLKSLQGATVAILVTAYPGHTTDEEARDAGAWQILPKPVNFAALFNLINAIVEQPLVLVVDDDRELCHNLRDVFRELEIRVALAHDVKEASERLTESEFRVVLIDLKLGTETGAAVFEMVRSRHPQARTLLITGCAHEVSDVVEEVLRQGADAVCFKPFDVPRLISAVRQLSAGTNLVGDEEATA